MKDSGRLEKENFQLLLKNWKEDEIAGSSS